MDFDDIANGLRTGIYSALTALTATLNPAGAVSAQPSQSQVITGAAPSRTQLKSLTAPEAHTQYSFTNLTPEEGREAAKIADVINGVHHIPGLTKNQRDSLIIGFTGDAGNAPAFFNKLVDVNRFNEAADTIQHSMGGPVPDVGWNTNLLNAAHKKYPASFAQGH